MARIRTLKPEFWTNEPLSEQREPTHMLAAQLLNYADDEGYFNANAKLIQAEVSPLREPSVSIPDSLIALARINYLQLGTGPQGRRYGRIVNFNRHQRINRPTPSKISALEISWDASLSDQCTGIEPSAKEGKGREGNKEGKIGGVEGGEPKGTSGFEEFYAAFPKQVAKPLAQKAWENAITKARPSDIIDGAKRYASDQAGKDPRFTKHPENWLKEERWLDDQHKAPVELIAPPGWGDAALSVSAEIGIERFNAYFGESEIVPGPPCTIRVFNKGIPGIVSDNSDVQRAIALHLGKETTVQYVPKVAA